MAKYNESEGNKRRWVLCCSSSVAALWGACRLVWSGFGSASTTKPRHFVNAVLQTDRAKQLKFFFYLLLSSSACRREDDMRAGPRYLSLEPPPPGCDPGEADCCGMAVVVVATSPGEGWCCHWRRRRRAVTLVGMAEHARVV